MLRISDTGVRASTACPALRLMRETRKAGTMARKMIVSQNQLDVIRRNKPYYMTDEKFEEWIEDNVELLLPLEPEPWEGRKTIKDGRLIDAGRAEAAPEDGAGEAR